MSDSNCDKSYDVVYTTKETHVRKGVKANSREAAKKATYVERTKAGDDTVETIRADPSTDKDKGK